MEVVTDAVVAVAAAVGSVVAVMGLFTWRQQLRGRTEWELARRLLRQVYRLRSAFSMVRSPMMLGGEIAAAFEEAGIEPEHDEPGYDKRTNRIVYQKRWSGLQEARSELEVEALEAEVLWGKEAQEALAPLRKCVGELFAAIQMYIHYTERNGQEAGVDPKRLEVERKVWEIGGDDDVLSRQIKEAVETVEDFLRPHLDL